MRPFLTLSLALCLAPLFAGCGDMSDMGGEPMPEAADTEKALTEPGCVAFAAALTEGEGWRTGFSPLDPAPRPSVAKPGFTIRLWVSDHALEAYRGLAVDVAPTANRTGFPRGAAVVREIFDADGRRTGVTATCRAQLGYNPDVSDLWFATLPGDVSPLARADEIRTGAIPACNGCHTFNDATDGLYGPILPD